MQRSLIIKKRCKIIKMDQSNKLNRIYTERGTGLKLAKVFDCTPITVCNALAGKSSSKLAMKIRRTALNQYNGKEIK